MRQICKNKDILKKYIERSEVVFQVSGELIEVSNEGNEDNRKALLEAITHSSNIVLYEKGSSFTHENFEDLDNWATSEDSLFLIEPSGVLICISRKIAIEQGMICE